MNASVAERLARIGLRQAATQYAEVADHEDEDSFVVVWDRLREAALVYAAAESNAKHYRSDQIKITEREIRNLQVNAEAADQLDVVQICRIARGVVQSADLSRDNARRRCEALLKKSVEVDGHIRDCGNGGDDPLNCSPACAKSRGDGK